MFAKHFSRRPALNITLEDAESEMNLAATTTVEAPAATPAQEPAATEPAADGTTAAAATPAEAGEAPMTIKIIIMACPRPENLAGGTVSKPAVLVVTLAKSAFHNLCQTGMPLKATFQSEIRIRTVPETISQTVMKITSIG